MCNEELTSICVVGDRFGAFATIPGVMTLSEALRKVKGGDFVNQGSVVRLVVGQGVSSHGTDYLEDVIRQFGAARHVLVDGEHLLDRARRGVAHKHSVENVLISRVRRLSASSYEADLLVDERNEIMSDHTTGYHMQGMLAVEASRQMFLATTEQFYLPESREHGYYFVLNQFNIDFTSFLFPVPASVQLDIQESDLEDTGRLSFKTLITVRQAGREAARSAVSYTAFDERQLSAIERRKAEKVVAVVLESASEVDERLSAEKRAVAS